LVEHLSPEKSVSQATCTSIKPLILHHHKHLVYAFYLSFTCRLLKTQTITHRYGPISIQFWDKMDKLQSRPAL